MVFGKHSLEGYSKQGLSLRDAFHRNSPPIGYEGKYQDWMDKQKQWSEKRDELVAAVRTAIEEVNTIQTASTNTESVTYHDTEVIDILGNVAQALINVDVAKDEVAVVTGQQIGNDVTANFSGVIGRKSAELIEAERKLSEATIALKEYEASEPNWLEQISDEM